MKSTRSIMGFLIGLLIILSSFISCKKEKTINLFNGQDLSGWHIDVPEMDTIPNTIIHLRSEMEC